MRRVICRGLQGSAGRAGRTASRTTARRGPALRSAALCRAVLRSAALCRAVLRSAALCRAVLRSAALRRAVLRHAVLRGAVLRGAAPRSGSGQRAAGPCRHPSCSRASPSGITHTALTVITYPDNVAPWTPRTTPPNCAPSSPWPRR
ncbi:pentapeptide repeat-containing protein [Streptomyces anulatus]